MKRLYDTIVRFFTVPRNAYLFGLLIAIVATSLEVFRGRCTNYYDYQDATVDFWNGVCPYTLEWVHAHGIYFLYTPVFNILFAPIFLLPWWLGPFVWNLTNYSLLFLAIWTLPERYKSHRMAIFWFLIILIEQAVFSCQYNLVVCYIFLFAYSLMERGKFFWAVLLIMISACTKIYGGVELALLICYPKFWKHAGYALGIGAVLLLSPALRLGFDGLIEYYQKWIFIMSDHHSSMDFNGIIFAPGFREIFLENYRIVQIIGLAILAACLFIKHKCWGDSSFRAQALGILMGFIILFSDCPESNTYVIALSGFMLCYYCWDKVTIFDRLLLVCAFIFLSIVPCDVFCPNEVYYFLDGTLYLNVFTFTLMWLSAIYRVMSDRSKKPLAISPGVR